jgi:hypothetical protein
MPLTTVLTNQVRPECTRRYEELVGKLAHEAQEKSEKWSWHAHQAAMGELGQYHFVSENENFQAIATRGALPELTARVLGPKETERWMEEISGCLLAQRYEVVTDRPELSYPPAQMDKPSPAAVVTAIRVRAGHQDACEELIRKIAEAIPKVDDAARMVTYQTLIGDLARYWTVRPIGDLGDLDKHRSPADLLNEAFGAAEGGLIFRTGLDAVDDVQRSILVFRPDLSNPA